MESFARRYVVLVLCLFFFSCNSRQVDTKKIIIEYDNIEFNEFFNVAIYANGGGVTETSYKISNFPYPEGEYREFYLTKNNVTSKILEDIQYYDLLNSGLISNKRDIYKIVSNFDEMNLMYLAVDSSYNIFISPISRERPFLLRLNDTILKEHLEIYGLSFTHYDNEWYLFDFYEK